MREELLHKVLLDLRKAYNVLNIKQYMEILVVYGLGKQTECLHQNYWNQLNTVAWAMRYYGATFKGYQGVTQGYPPSTNIFNMLVDVVIKN